MAINADGLRVAGNIEIVNDKMLFTVCELVGMYGVHRVADEQMRFLDIKCSDHLLFFIGESKLDLDIDKILLNLSN